MVAARRVADVLQIWEEVRIFAAQVRSHQGAWREVRLDQAKHLPVEVIAPIEEEEVNVLAEVLQGVERIADSQRDDIVEPRLGEILACGFGLAAKQLGRDE